VREGNLIWMMIPRSQDCHFGLEASGFDRDSADWKGFSPINVAESAPTFFRLYLDANRLYSSAAP